MQPGCADLDEVDGVVVDGVQRVHGIDVKVRQRRVAIGCLPPAPNTQPFRSFIHEWLEWIPYISNQP